METKVLYELIGYIASVLVAVSLTMRSLLRLRLLNLLGALFFTAYGVLIQAWPVAAVNGFIVLVDVYYLWQMTRSQDAFEILQVSPASRYVQRFLSFYADEIRHFEPDFVYRPEMPGLITLFVLRNMVPAGLFIARENGEEAEVLLDFAIPGYRDLKIGRFLYGQHPNWLGKHGIRRLVAKARVPEHIRYLKRMGYRPTERGFEREVA